MGAGSVEVTTIYRRRDRDFLDGKNLRTRALQEVAVLLSQVESCLGLAVKVDFPIAHAAKGDEIFRDIVTQRTSQAEVVDLQET